MFFDCWLAVSRSGSGRMRMNKPDLDNDEIAVRINLDIPDHMFEDPHIQANISVDGNTYSNNPITQQELNIIADEIEHQTGLHFNVTMDEDDSQ